MGASGLILLAALAGGGYYAYRAGYLDKLFAAAGNAAGGSGNTGGNVFTPASSPTVGKNEWEQVLFDNWQYVQPWARANYQWVAAMIQQESGSQGSRARGGAGEIGLMQVKPGTAQEMVNRGYGQFQATEAAMGSDAGGVYFGTAYLQYLSGIKSDRAWVTKAYNGGPGWESLSDSYKAAREAYLAGVTAKYKALYGGVTV